MENLKTKNEDSLLQIQTVNMEKDDTKITSETEPLETSDTIIEKKHPNNPYSYLERDRFSSERFKVVIRNLPKLYGLSEFKKLIKNKFQIELNKIKSPFLHAKWIFVCFKSEEDREKAISALDGFLWKGSKLKVEKARAAPDPFIRKRKEAEKAVENVESKKLKVETLEEQLKNSTIPYWNKPYESQLEFKNQEIQQILRDLAKEIAKINPSLNEWINNQKSLFTNFPCEFVGIKRPNTINNYRNKCEFSVGIDKITNLPVVGFRFGSYKSGTVEVGPPDSLFHIQDSMKVAAKLFEKFITTSKYSVYDFVIQKGVFRALTVRWSCLTNDQMLIIGVHLTELNDDEIIQFKKDLIDFFTNNDAKEAKVISLYMNIYEKKKEHVSNMVHLWGETHLTDKLFDLKFCISPDSFFQVNNSGTELLYKSIEEIIDSNQPKNDKFTLLDICCGIGTIGLCLAHKCKKVIGLEMNAQAIENAKKNAEINNIKNVEFFEGKAENLIASVCQLIPANESTIAVIDPPRAGLHHKGIAQIRNSSRMKNLVYVSCNPRMAFKNFIDLARSTSQNYGGNPFVPVKAVAVDLFPHTVYFELIIYFERFEKNNTKFSSYYK